jgi:starch synthase
MNAVQRTSPDPGRRLRVLVIAKLANPDWVSVPLVGWFHWHALSKIVDGHLVTHERNRQHILDAGESPDRLTVVDTKRLDRPINGLSAIMQGHPDRGLTTAMALGSVLYYYFEHILWRELGGRIRAHEWDIVHRLTPLSPTMPSILASKCARHGVPFVLGPLNGGLPWPKGFGHMRISEGEWLSYVREAYKLLPGYRDTRRFASAIITGSKDTRAQIAATYQDKTVYIPENGIDPTRFTQHRSGPVTLPLKVAFVGRLTRWKGIDMVIEAAAQLVRDGRVKLDLIGDGPEAASLRALAAREGLPESIFAGWVENKKLQERLTQSDVFASPSIREFGGGAVLEAMALGLVPIVVDYGGPAEFVSPNTGFRLPVQSRAGIIDSLRALLERLAADPSSLQAMGERARAHVFRSFTWDAKAAQVLEVYRWVLGQRSKPDFGMPFPEPTSRAPPAPGVGHEVSGPWPRAGD